MQTLRQDIAYALRQMRQSPVFTLTAMLTLALGIGATTAIFSLINSVMLEALPVKDPANLYRVGDGQNCCVEGDAQGNWGMFSYRFYQQIEKNTPEFEQAAAFQAGGFVPLAQRVKYPDPVMQMIEDMTHQIQGGVLEIHGSMEGMEPAIRKALADVDPNITLLSIQTLADQVDARFDQQRTVAQMTALFGILALILAAVGLYGVTAYTVERRTSEIGVRMALGADRGRVMGLVLRGAFLQIMLGLAIGIPASIGSARLIARQLYHVKGWDPVVLTGSIVLLSLCALVASLLPARRAASIDPMRALRVE